MNSALALIEAGAASLGIRLPEGAIERFERYLGELLQWRGRLNLTSATTADELVTSHCVISLIPLACWTIPEAARVTDVGSGAGFPGVPMKIARPDLRIVLLEASRRKAAFLEHLIRVLDLDGLDVAWARAEEVGRQDGFREAFAVAVERAVGGLAVSAELCLPLVRPGGVAIFLKGPTVWRDLGQASSLVARLGGVIDPPRTWALGMMARTTVAVIIRKVANTPAGYPRRRRHWGRVTGPSPPEPDLAPPSSI